MKLVIVLISLAAIAVTSTEARSNKRCSFTDYKAVDRITLLGRWIGYSRYDNGPQSDTKCSFYEVAENDVASIIVRTFIWEDNVRSCMKGYLTYTSKDFATFYADWTDDADMPVAIVSTDYASYVIGRACYENEEYVWIFTKTTKPSKETVRLIDEAIIEQNLDKSRLRRACVGFEDSELINFS